MAGLLGAASALTSRAPRIVHAGRRSEAANCSICAMCARDATRARATEPALGAWIQTLDITPPDVRLLCENGFTIRSNLCIAQA